MNIVSDKNRGRTPGHAVPLSPCHPVTLSPGHLFILLACLFLLTGCHSVVGNIFDKKGPETVKTGGGKDTVTATMLVNYMNENAQRLKTLNCMDVVMTASVGYTQLITFQLDGKLMAQQPRDFRLKAYMTGGKTAVDLGSNDQEFWYWFTKGDPYQFYCSYNDMKAGTVKFMPLPFQPEWIMETLGMGEYGPAERYQLKDMGDRIQLIEIAKSPQGAPVRKIIVFNRKPAAAPTPQILAFRLEDEKGGEICTATIQSDQLDTKNAGRMPEKLSIWMPKEKFRLSLRLVNPHANVPVSPAAFARQKMPGFPSLDLATGKVDGQTTSIQQAQGWLK